MEISQEREQQIEQRVKRRIQRRVLLMINAGLWLSYGGIVIIGRLDYIGIVPVIGIVWLLAVIVHAALFAYREWIEHAVRRELELERNAYYRALAEKPKRGERLSLTDDGEFDDEIGFDEREYRKRG